jgi:TetR/AcrR family transcriptional regulator, mexJK operon transcriptional repressor
MTRSPQVTRRRAERPPASENPAALPSAKASAVLAGARKIFLTHGFSVATTDMIQQAAGVSKSTVYAHYPTKEALFTAVVEAECEQFIKTIRELTFSEAHLAKKLTEIGQAYLAMVLSPDILAVYRIIVSEAPRFPDLARRFYLAGPGAMNALVADMLDTALTKGQLDLGGVGRTAAAILFVNMIRGEPQMQCLTHPQAPASAAQRDQWVEDAVATFLRAFQKKRDS